MPPTKTPAGPRGRQGQQRRAEGDRTRELLMDTAEQLFASAGVEGASIRSINAAAGVSPASVHYHFRDKDGLVRAVIERRGGALVRRQLELLDAGSEGRRKPRAEDAVRLLADPMFEVIRADPVGGGRWLTILAGMVAADDDRVYLGGFGPGSVEERVNTCALAAFPDVPETVVLDRWRMASTALLGLLAGSVGRLAQPDEDAARAELDHIIRFVAGGMERATRPT